MTCEGCAVGIEKALRKVPGVEAMDVSFERAEALIGVPSGGTALRIREGSTPEAHHKEIYKLLDVPTKFIPEKRHWTKAKKAGRISD